MLVLSHPRVSAVDNSKHKILLRLGQYHLLSDQTFWQKFFKNGVIKTNFYSYVLWWLTGFTNKMYFAIRKFEIEP